MEPCITHKIQNKRYLKFVKSLQDAFNIYQVNSWHSIVQHISRFPEYWNNGCRNLFVALCNCITCHNQTSLRLYQRNTIQGELFYTFIHSSPLSLINLYDSQESLQISHLTMFETRTISLIHGGFSFLDPFEILVKQDLGVVEIWVSHFSWLCFG